MVTELQPNMWYTMYQVFGESLHSLDRLWTKEEDGLFGLLTLLRQGTSLQDSATFKGSEFIPSFDFEAFLLEQLAKTYDGESIYFPVDSPSYANITRIQAATALEVRTGKYSPVEFIINPVLEEDLTGEFFVSTMPGHTSPSGAGIRAREYRYRMLLRSKKGIYVSDMPAIFVEDAAPYIVFSRWHPPNPERLGLLYVPLEYQKVAPLEIMLQEK